MIRRVIMTALLFLLMQGLVFAQPNANIEFYGTIQSSNSTAIVINGQIVDVHGALVNAPLTTGMGVRVQATILPDGSLAARQIDVLPPGIIPGIVEINGTVTNVAQPILTVSGQAIDMTGAEISGSIVLGQIVRVFAVATAPGVWQARFVDAVHNIPIPVTTPEVGSSVILPPVTTPEVQSPITTPEVGGNSGDDSGGGDNSGGGDG